MARKKVQRAVKKKVKRAAKKSPAKRAATGTKAAAPKRSVRRTKSTVQKSPTAGRTVKRKTVVTQTSPSAAKQKRAANKRPTALGRPKVPGTAELDQMFLKDYEARQVFAFLGVKTVKELEEHPPDEIIERLTGPMVRTVNRIRKALAVNNRYLAGDEKFAIQFTQQIR